MGTAISQKNFSGVETVRAANIVWAGAKHPSETSARPFAERIKIRNFGFLDGAIFEQHPSARAGGFVTGMCARSSHVHSFMGIVFVLSLVLLVIVLCGRALKDTPPIPTTS